MGRIGKIVALLVCVCVFASVLSGCGGNGGSGGNGANTIKVVLMGSKPAGFDKVVEKFHAETKDTLGITLNVEWIAQGDMKEKMKLRLTAGEEADLVFDAPWLNLRTFAANGMYKDLTEYFNNPEYPGLQKSFTPELVKANHFFGGMYAVPIMRTYGQGIDCVYYRKDLADKHGVGEVDSYDKLQSYFEALLANEPDMIPLGVSSTRGFYQMFAQNGVEQAKNHIVRLSAGGPFFHVLLNEDNTGCVTAVYEGAPLSDYKDFPEPYKSGKGLGLERLEKIREWNKYLERDSLNQKDAGAIFKGGKSGALIDNLDGYETMAKDIKTAMPESELGTFIIPDAVRKMEDGARTTMLTANNFLSIPETSKKADLSIKFLDWLYSSAENHDLFEFGIEGENWEPAGDDKYTALKVDGSNYNFPGYLMTWNKNYVRFTTELPENVFQYKKYDLKTEAYYVSPLAGFTFDSTSVTTELAKVNPIINEVHVPLEHGILDNPVKTLRENREKAMANDLGKVQAELIKQVNAFLENK